MCLHFLLFFLDSHAPSNGFIYFVTASDIYQIFPIAHLCPDFHACLFGFGSTSAVAPAFLFLPFCCFLTDALAHVIELCFVATLYFGFGSTSAVAPASRNSDGRSFVCCFFVAF